MSGRWRETVGRGGRAGVAWDIEEKPEWVGAKIETKREPVGHDEERGDRQLLCPWGARWVIPCSSR